ncbi:hypothetical protein Dimus_020721, partial [Dionaea muscipula]
MNIRDEMILKKGSTTELIAFLHSNARDDRVKANVIYAILRPRQPRTSWSSV